MEQLLLDAQELVVPFSVNLAAAILILLVGIWLAGRLSALIRRGMDKRQVDPTISTFVARLLYYLLVAFVLVAVLGRIGVQTASIIAVLGAAGLAVGLALQGSLSNFASGVLLILFRPCRVGDYVEAGGCAGTVEDITMFSTVLVTPDNKVVTLPNTAVLSSPIVNYSVRGERRVDITVGISYDSDIRQAKQELKALAEADPRVSKDRDMTIAVSALADSSVNLVLRVWVATADYWGVYFDLTERIKLRFDEVGITIPFPQVHLHIPGKE